MRIPILKIGAILLTSIASDITDEHVSTLQSEILDRVKQTRARGVIVDITGLDVLDSYMALILNETVRMVRLMGCEVVISGMNPMVAMTLLEMGRQLIDVTTALNLELGLESLRERIAETDDDDRKAFSDDPR
jgi:rsbT antagonist protein RsbS